ncbi:MAG: hypothetical protein M3277_04850 [Actinomycetota bacterium]|nr:hypothetical protein [Actinomycetota bacterium]
MVLAGETDGVSGRDYSLISDPGSGPAGKVTFEVEVESGLHALTVIRTDLPPDQLPTTDGTSFVAITDEQIEVMGFHQASENNFSLETQLDTGSYVLICNVGGHYTSGMRTAFDVS